MNLAEMTEKLSLVIKGYGDKFAIHDRSPDWHLLKIQEEVGELSSAYLKSTGRARTNQTTSEDLKKNLQDEIADVLAMTLLFAKNQGINPEKAIHEKWFRYLKTSDGKDL